MLLGTATLTTSSLNMESIVFASQGKISTWRHYIASAADIRFILQMEFIIDVCLASKLAEGPAS